MKFFLYSSFAISLIFSFPLWSQDSQEKIHEWISLKGQENLSGFKNWPSEFKIELFESPLRYGNQILFQVYDSSKKPRLISYNLTEAGFQNLNWDKGRIYGWSTNETEIFIRTKSKLVTIDPISFKVKSEVSFPKTATSWKDFVFRSDKLYFLNNKIIESYNVKTQEIAVEGEIPYNSVQRFLLWHDGNFAFLSTYWGSKINVLDSKKYEHLEEIKFPANHRSLFKMTISANGYFLITDPLTSTYSEYSRFGDNFIQRDDNSQINSEKNIIRYSPIENSFQYFFSVEAKEDLSAFKVNFVLPKLSMYSQEIREELFSKSSSVKLDRFENRILTLEVPDLKKGETFTHIPYKAILTRYKVTSDLTKIKLKLSDYKYPKSLEQYTEDFDRLNFADERIVSKRNEIIGNKQEIGEILNQIQKYVSSIPYKSGKFESAPKVVEKNNGGCTEHTYVTMAMLRSLGIPSRLVWNYLPTESIPRFYLNHKFAEVWVPDYGWIPMEPLSPPYSKAGTTFARHVVFATMRKVELADIAGGDRLYQLQTADLSKNKMIKTRFEIQKFGIDDRFENTEFQIQSREIQDGSETIVP